MDKLSVADAAFIMHKTPTFIRKGLQENALPFGVAVKIRNRYSYHISPIKFANYIGIDIPDLEALVNGKNKKNCNKNI